MADDVAQQECTTIIATYMQIISCKLVVAMQYVSWIISSWFTCRVHHIWNIKSNMKILEAPSVTKVTIFKTEKRVKSMMTKKEETVKKEGR